MKSFISCGTCKNNPGDKSIDNEKCPPCLAKWLETNGESMPNWEDALPCCKNEKANPND